MARKLVYGVGINDSCYQTKVKLGAGYWRCPFYRVWCSMLQRCYDKKFKHLNQTYLDCHVCENWLTFSEFKSWMEKQDWQGKHLDKDLIRPKNKIYSPDTCVFIDRVVNNFILDARAIRGEYPVGVYFNKQAGKFRASCCNPFSGKQEHLGYFDCQHDAHKAWKSKKLDLAIELSKNQKDQKVAKSLLCRYAV